MNKHDVDPAQNRGRRALRKVRDELRPSPGFEARLEQALRDAEALAPPRRAQRATRLRLPAPLMLPAALAVLVGIYVAQYKSPFDAVSVAEHQMEIPLEGEGALAVKLSLHHHGTASTDIAVNAPRDVSLATREGEAAPPTACGISRCRYEFSHDAANQAPAMRVRIAKPGRYRMEVEHRSNLANVREVFVIHARR